MTCRAFDAILKQPDNGASNSQLYKLISAKEYNGSTLPLVAENYLRAFCDSTISYTRRRWVGVALAGMLGVSPTVVSHIKNMKQLSGLGDIILSNTEREETKIVAALILRQAFEQGIEGERFWASEKVRNSMPKFPEKSGPRWMSDFQSFLDTLDQLALTKSTTDPVILYPISVESSDGLRWVGSDNAVPITIVQSDALTILLPDIHLKDIRFLDIPITHIHDLRGRPSAPLHDSQSQSTNHQPWDLVLTLQHEEWTYLVNTSERATTGLTILFQRSEDARECELAVKELQTPKVNTQHSKTQPTVLKQHTVCRSDPIDISRRRQCPQPHIGTHQSSSDWLSKNPQTEVQSPQLMLSGILVEQSRERPHQGSANTQPVRVQPPRKAAQKQDKIGAPFQEPVQESDQKRVPPNKQHTKVQEQVHALLRSTAEKQPLQQSVHGVGELPNSPNGAISANESMAAHRATPTSPVHNSGKLPKVSQVTRKKAAQQLCKQQDVFDLPDERPGSSATRKLAASKKRINVDSVSCAPPDRAKLALHSTPSTISQPKKRSRRKMEEDDDFVLGQRRPKKNTRAKRKSVSEVTSATEQSKKKAKTEQKLTVDDATSRDESSCLKETQHGKVANNDEPREEIRSCCSKRKGNQKYTSSDPSSRPSLIGTLLGSQKPSQVTKAAFVKPDLPIRAQDRPSTPTQRQTQPSVSLNAPRTPTERRKSLHLFVSSIPSSPPIQSLAEGDYTRPQRKAIEAEILSSNSKPVPASPHAESTAISGHADCEDIFLEKEVGDLQTARSDPFKKRHDSQKLTPFTRRLTGDNHVDDDHKSSERLSYMTFNLRDAPSSPTLGDTPFCVTGQSKHRKKSNPGTKASIPQPITQAMVFQGTSNQVKFAHAEAIEQQRQDPNVLPVHRSSISKTIRCAEGSKDGSRRGSHMAIDQHRRSRYPTTLSWKVTPRNEEENVDVEMADSVLPILQENIKHTQPRHTAELQDDNDVDGSTTLVNHESEDSLPIINVSSLHFPSSPPVIGEPSSHSSTSAELSPSSERTAPTSDVEEIEWEASLKPHQRSIHDRFKRVLQRVSRHIFDNETAVTDIVDMFADDGEHLLTKALEQQNETYEAVWEDIDHKKEEMRSEMERSVKTLAKERKRVKDAA